MSNNSDLLGGLMGLGMVGLAGYAGYKMVEAHGEAQGEQQRRAAAAERSRLAFLQSEREREQRAIENRVEGHIRKMDSAIDSMLEDEESLTVVIGRFVPEMDETNWEIFVRLLADKARSSEVASMALCIADLTRSAAAEVTQLISHSVDEAAELVSSMWSTKDEAERVGFVLALQSKARNNVRARALLGRLTA